MGRFTSNFSNCSVVAICLQASTSDFKHLRCYFLFYCDCDSGKTTKKILDYKKA